MLEGLTALEIADYSDVLRRRGLGWREVPPVRPTPPWSTLSGFADRVHFLHALARSWPMFPVTGDNLILLRIFDFPISFILMKRCIAVPLHELPL